MSFKENLQYLRGSRNMTQEQLAMLLGVSRQAISKWESEKAYPEMDKLLMLCDMFGVTLDDLVMGDVRASAGCGGAGRVDLAADTDGMAASVGAADAAVGAVPGVIGFAASQVAGMSDSGESDVRDTNPNVCLGAVAGERRAGHGMHVGWRDCRSRFADTGRNHAWRFPPSPPVCAGFLHG